MPSNWIVNFARFSVKHRNEVSFAGIEDNKAIRLAYQLSCNLQSQDMKTSKVFSAGIEDVEAVRKQAQPQAASSQPEAVTAEKARTSGPAAPAAAAPAAPAAATSTMHRFLRKASQAHCSSHAVFCSSVSLVASHLELVILTAIVGVECDTTQQIVHQQVMH